MYLVGALQIFSGWQLYRVKLSYIDILKIRTYELTYSVLKKLLIYTKFVTVIDLLCVIQTLLDSGFIENSLNIMLNLGLSFLHIVVAYKK